MASAGLLALIDDIATILDDVAVLSKVAAKKTAGVLGDDLALNAQQVSDIRAERELPVVWAVARGSIKNKAILVPAALLLSVFIPWLITPLLMFGGAYLCFEGFEKIAQKLWHKQHVEDHKQLLMDGLADPDLDFVVLEKEKIKGAIRTDFILSAEIVVIALGIVQGAALAQQILVVVLIAAAMTVGVYGIVAAIVKLDDLGLYLMQHEQQSLSGTMVRRLGQVILHSCPYLMKVLSVAGTAAMFLVGGGILVHSVPVAHDVLHRLSSLSWTSNFPELVISGIYNAVVGVLIGAFIVGAVELVKYFGGGFPGEKMSR